MSSRTQKILLQSGRAGLSLNRNDCFPALAKEFSEGLAVVGMVGHEMKTIHFGRWELSWDQESTRKAYAAVSLGSPEECGCEPCKNFAAARCQVYEPPVLALFDQLGIAANREVEIYHMARLGSGRHLYGGWFHFVGSIISGADAAKQVADNIWQPDLEKTSDYFSLGFSSRLELVRESFRGFPLVQLEFTAKVPWVLDSPEPQ